MARQSFAAIHLRSLRTDRGLSPEALSWEIHRKGYGDVSGHTIRRVERGATPTPRVQYAIASYFGKRPTELWPLDQRTRAAA